MIKKFFVILIPFLILGVSFSQLPNVPLSTCSFGNDFNDNTVITVGEESKLLPIITSPCGTIDCIFPVYIGVISWIIILFSLFPIGKIIIGIIEIFTTKDPLLKYTIGIKHIKSGINWLIVAILLWIGIYFLYSNLAGVCCGISMRMPFEFIYELFN